MKSPLSYLKIVVLFILIDAFLRGLYPAIHHYEYAGNSRGGFFNTLLFYMKAFIIRDSWTYLPVTVLFLFISKFFKKDKTHFVWGGVFTALISYLLACKLYSTDEVGKPEFYNRIILYSLMGGYFGRIHFKAVER